VGGGELLGKGSCWVGGEYSTIKCVHMYVNAKMLPVETTPGIRGGEDKGEWLTI
jgi:hypothetical protein